MGKPKNKIPDRWEEYVPMGQRVRGTHFLPFKTPLSETLLHRPGRYLTWFTARSILRSQPQLKAVINLTDTQRYYHPNVFIDAGVQYKRIAIRGRVLPPPEKVLEFFETVDKFLNSFGNDPNALIGVHCTHGLNRTGYLICKYMVERMKINPHQAIKDFEQARGYPIERQNYIDDIFDMVTYESYDRDNRHRKYNLRPRYEQHHQQQQQQYENTIVYSELKTNYVDKQQNKRTRLTINFQNESVYNPFQLLPNIYGQTNQIQNVILRKKTNSTDTSPQTCRLQIKTKFTDTRQNNDVNYNLKTKTTINSQQDGTENAEEQQNKNEKCISIKTTNITDNWQINDVDGNLKTKTTTNNTNQKDETKNGTLKWRKSNFKEQQNKNNACISRNTTNITDDCQNDNVNHNREIETNIIDDRENKNVVNDLQMGTNITDNHVDGNLENSQKDDPENGTLKMETSNNGEQQNEDKKLTSTITTNTIDDYQNNKNRNDNLEMKTNMVDDQQNKTKNDSIKQERRNIDKSRNTHEERNLQMKTNRTYGQQYKRMYGNLDVKTSINWRTEPKRDWKNNDAKFGKHWRSKPRQLLKKQNYYNKKQKTQSHWILKRPETEMENSNNQEFQRSS